MANGVCFAMMTTWFMAYQWHASNWFENMYQWNIDPN